jgi:hypothetical protein
MYLVDVAWWMGEKKHGGRTNAGHYPFRRIKKNNQMSSLGFITSNSKGSPHISEPDAWAGDSDDSLSRTTSSDLRSNRWDLGFVSRLFTLTFIPPRRHCRVVVQ